MTSVSSTPHKRSFTGHHLLMPAAQEHTRDLFISIIPTQTFMSWTFGRGTVIWRLWPAVLLHTAFAAVVVSVSMKTNFRMDVPPVLLTVLGVVIGFVISYRASSGYDRYWMGRTSWSDIVRNARGISRIIWFHIPSRLSPRTPDEVAEGVSKRSQEEMLKVMAEKRMALDLVEGFVVALKHHLRGEMGVYYEDLYHLVRPLHEHVRSDDHSHREQNRDHDHDLLRPDEAEVRSRTKPHPPHPISLRSRASSPSTSPANSTVHLTSTPDPIIPAINTYGTFNPTRPSRSRSRPTSRGSAESGDSSASVESRPLLPSMVPNQGTGLMSSVSRDLIPFESIFHFIHRFFRRKPKLELPGNGLLEDESTDGDDIQPKWKPVTLASKSSHTKHRPAVAGGGQNLPLAILRCLSDYVSVLDDRATMNGNANAGLYTYLSNFEDNLSTLERILTTPLPFVYSAHIRHTVWIYLFFLPFQLIDQFAWSTIPGVGIASFIYLGFLAAGEEIEQPFGYDENDLDLDLFCQQIVHKDIDGLKGTPCLNAYLTHRGKGPTYRSIVQTSSKVPREQQAQDMFGVL